MTEIPKIELSEITRIFKRRWLWLLTPLVLGIGIAWLAAWMTPETYEASTLILVEGQKVPAAYVKTTVTSRIEERLATLEQQITNRDNLEKLIVEGGLYSDLLGEVPMNELVDMARGSLSVRVLRGQLFRISFQDSDPDVVAPIANRVADMFIDENLKLRARHAENTTDFLEAELEATKAELEGQEGVLSKFMLRNEGQLPEQREVNLSAIAQMQTKLELNKAAIERSEIQKAMILRDLSGDEVLTVETPAEESQLDELRAELQQLQSQFTDRHPDVIRLKAQLENLEESEKSYEISDSVEVETLTSLPSQERESQLRDAEKNLDELKQERDRLLTDVGRYQHRLEMTPRVEQQMIGITRDYDNLKGSYESLLTKRLDARLAENLERKQQSEQFRKLEEARRPSAPISPNQTMYLLVGTVLGGALGVGLTLLREQSDQRLDTEDSIRKAFPGVPFVVLIPHLSVETRSRIEVEQRINSA